MRKYLISSILVLNYSIIVSIIFPLRASGDSDQNVIGVFDILNTGHIPSIYPSGVIYETHLAISTVIFDTNLFFTDFYSPLVGTTGVILSVAYLSEKLHMEPDHRAIGVLILASVPLLMARTRQTTHKSISIPLVIFLFCLGLQVIRNGDVRHTTTFIILTVCTSLTNIYFAVFGILGVVLGASFQYFNTRKSYVILSAAVLAIVISIPLYFPLVSLSAGLTRINIILSLLEGVGSTTDGGSVGFTGRILYWGFIDMWNISIPRWLIWSVGTISAIIIAIIGSVFIFVRGVVGDETESFLLGIGLTYAVLFVGIFLVGDFSVAKRMVPIPLVVTVPYAISKSDIENKTIVNICICFCIIFIFLSTPRVAPIYNYAPHDWYVDGHGLATSIHIVEYKLESVIVGDDIYYATGKYHGYVIDRCDLLNQQYGIVYDNARTIRKCIK